MIFRKAETYVLFDTDLEAGVDVDFMTQKVADEANSELEEKGELVRWIPYPEYEEKTDQRRRSLQELHSSLLKKVTARHS